MQCRSGRATRWRLGRGMGCGGWDEFLSRDVSGLDVSLDGASPLAVTGPSDCRQTSLPGARVMAARKRDAGELGVAADDNSGERHGGKPPCGQENSLQILVAAAASAADGARPGELPLSSSLRACDEAATGGAPITFASGTGGVRARVSPHAAVAMRQEILRLQQRRVVDLAPRMPASLPLWFRHLMNCSFWFAKQRSCSLRVVASFAVVCEENQRFRAPALRLVATAAGSDGTFCVWDATMPEHPVVEREIIQAVERADDFIKDVSDERGVYQPRVELTRACGHGGTLRTVSALLLHLPLFASDASTPRFVLPKSPEVTPDACRIFCEVNAGGAASPSDWPDSTIPIGGADGLFVPAPVGEHTLYVCSPQFGLALPLSSPLEVALTNTRAIHNLHATNERVISMSLYNGETAPPAHVRRPRALTRPRARAEQVRLSASSCTNPACWRSPRTSIGHPCSSRARRAAPFSSWRGAAPKRVAKRSTREGSWRPTSARSTSRACT